MDADKRGLRHKELTETIIGVFFEVYNELGHGFLESVYEKAFEIALNAKGLDVGRQIQFKSQCGFEGTGWVTSLRTCLLTSWYFWNSKRRAPWTHLTKLRFSITFERLR